jgi:hypothetical protein
MLRALQDDVTNGVQRGNHDGGVIQIGGDRGAGQSRRFLPLYSMRLKRSLPG